MISVVIPIYNVEKYIFRCIDSLQNQTYKDFELILIDDGSTDNSPSICDELEKKYSNIKVIHQDNSGPSIARNKGLEIANGNYITFVDSDDFVNNRYLECLINLIIKYDADLSCCEFQIFNDIKSIISPDENSKEYCFSGEKAISEMLYGNIHGTSACAILLKSKIAKEIKFQPNKLHEDDLISFKYFGAANKVASTKKKLYYYYERDGSITHTEYGKAQIDQLDAADYIVEQCKKYGKEVQNASIVKKYLNYCEIFFKNPKLKELDSNTYFRIKKEINKIKFKILRNKNIGKRSKIEIIVLLLFGFNFFQKIHFKLYKE